MNGVKNTIKNILSKYTFLIFCPCFVSFYASLGGKNQKLLSRFLCCKSFVLECLNVFISWLKSRDLFRVKLCTTGKYPTCHLCDILLETKPLPVHHLHYKSCRRSFVISISLLASFAIVSVPYLSQEARYLTLSTAFFSYSGFTNNTLIIILSVKHSQSQ